MSRRPTAVSWDSDDDELLKEDPSQVSGVSAFPKSKSSFSAKPDSEDEFDENALLYSDEEDSVTATQRSINDRTSGDKKKTATSSIDSKKYTGSLKSVSNKKTFTKITAPSPDHKTKSTGLKKESKTTNKHSYSPILAPSERSKPQTTKQGDFEEDEVLEILDPEEDSLFDESKDAVDLNLDNSQQDFEVQDTEVMYEDEPVDHSTLVIDEPQDLDNSSALEDTTIDVKAPSDSESDSDGEEKGRGRFKTERSISNTTSITTVKSKPRDTIPDTLEISEEQQAQIDEFMTQGSKGRGRGRGRGYNRRGGPQGRFQPYSQQAPQQQAWSNQGQRPSSEPQQPNQYPYPQQVPPQPTQPLYQPEPQQHIPSAQQLATPHISLPGQVTSQPQPRKILINPHFRGSRPQSVSSQPARSSGGVYTGPQMPGPHVVSSHQPQPLLSLQTSQQHTTNHESNWPVHSQSAGPPYPVQNAPPATHAARFPNYPAGPRSQQPYPGPGGPPQPLMQSHPPAGPPYGQPHHQGSAPFTGSSNMRMQGPAVPFQQPQQQRYPSQHLHHPPPHAQQLQQQSLLGAPPGHMMYQSPPGQQFHPGGLPHRPPIPPHQLMQGQPPNQHPMRGPAPQRHPGHQPHRMPQQHGMQMHPIGKQPPPLMNNPRPPRMQQHIRPNLQQRSNNIRQGANHSKISKQQILQQSQKLKERAKKFQINKQQQQHNPNQIQSISTLINRVGQKRPSSEKPTVISPSKIAKKTPEEDKSFQKAMEEQKRQREEVKRMKEARRQAVAVIKRKELEQKLASQGKTIEDVEGAPAKAADPVPTSSTPGHPASQGQANQPRNPNANVRPQLNKSIHGSTGPVQPHMQTRPPGMRPNVQGIRLQPPNVNQGPRNQGPGMQGLQNLGPRQHGPRPQNLGSGPRNQGSFGPRNQGPYRQRNPGSSAPGNQIPRNQGPRPQTPLSPENKAPVQPSTSVTKQPTSPNRLVTPPANTIVEGNTNQNNVGEGMVKKKRVTILRKNAQGEVIHRKVIWKPFTEETERQVTVNNDNSQRTVINSSASRVIKLGGQSQRKVIDNTQQRRVVVGSDTGPSLSRVISVDNLSSSTTEAKLRKMAEEIGPLSGLEHIKVAKKAKITFINPKHAVEFVNKYHRHMLDLSHLTVTLIPG